MRNTGTGVEPIGAEKKDGAETNKSKIPHTPMSTNVLLVLQWYVTGPRMLNLFDGTCLKNTNCFD